jgi:hypothetical protein
MEIIIYSSLILITLVCLWSIIIIPKNYLFKALLIPVMIIISVSTWYTYQSILGYGTDYKPKGKVIYLYHLADRQEGLVYVLLISAGETEPRLHIYPYTAGLSDAFTKSDKKRIKGDMVVGELKLDDDKWLFYEMPPNVWMPKNSQ